MSFKNFFWFISTLLVAQSSFSLPSEQEWVDYCSNSTGEIRRTCKSIRRALNIAHNRFRGRWPQTFRALEKCTSLELINEKIITLEPLRGFTNIELLTLSGNQIDDLSPLTTLKNLKYLYLIENQISDISPLSNLLTLKELTLTKNYISDITPLSNLTQLKKLLLSENQIKNIHAISNLKNLQSLFLSKNQIFDISPLSSLTHLGELGLSHNIIYRTRSLLELINLTYLNLSHNQISDLVDLSSLTELSKLDVSNNPLNESSLLSLEDLSIKHLTIKDRSLDHQETQYELSVCNYLTYKEFKNNQVENNSCILCFEDYQDDDIITYSDNCPHIHHYSCLSKWYRKKVECPICRNSNNSL